VARERAELLILRRELEARLAAAKAWEAEVESYYLQARGLGLLPDSEAIAPSWSLEKYILELRKVPTLVQSMDIPDVKEGTNEAAAVEFSRVANEEDQLAQETGLIRRRLDKVEQLSVALSHYGSDLVSQEDRLQGVGWFGEKLHDTHVCPVCAAVHNDGNTRLDELQTLAQEMSTLTASVHQAPAKLDRELAALRVELREKEVLLGKARQKRKYLESQSATLAAQRQRIRQIYLFVGRVQQALENVSASSNVDELRKQMQQLAARIAQLRRELDPNSQRDKLRAAFDKVSAGTVNYARLLQLEHAAENVKLNLRELTLQFSPLSGRTDFLWEVGSGQNWVGYHVAGILALHEHFLGMHDSPVANFLVIDQPSQVYFPEAWPSIEHAPNAPGKADRSPDIEGVHRIFSALSAFLDAVSAQFQIIVTEHAGSITWRGVPHVHPVGNWREGHDQFLIPDAWIHRQ
jgi:hypothetical protein